jgi:hypothetical protein
MSAYPLPTAGCECATCKWLRDNGMTEAGPRQYSGVSNQMPRCAVCGEYVLGQGGLVDHFCKSRTDGSGGSIIRSGQ